MARRIVLEVARICGAISCHALTHFFLLDGLATNLEKGYRPAGDLIIEDADYQPAGIPSLCIEVCPTFYRDWTIPELVMPVHDMSRSMSLGLATTFSSCSTPLRPTGATIPNSAR